MNDEDFQYLGRRAGCLSWLLLAGFAVLAVAVALRLWGGR